MICIKIKNISEMNIFTFIIFSALILKFRCNQSLESVSSNRTDANYSSTDYINKNNNTYSADFRDSTSEEKVYSNISGRNSKIDK